MVTAIDLLCMFMVFFLMVILILNVERILQKIMNFFFIALDVNCKYFNIFQNKIVDSGI